MGGADSFRNIQQNFKIANSVWWNVFSFPTTEGEFLSKGCLRSHPWKGQYTHKYRGVSLDFPALKNAIDRCAVTLRWSRTNQRKLSGQGKESALAFGSEEDAK
ncbi:hypothetical protein TNCV_985871 [Trichonephila clavipes]|uniref:Uncharacterized protein n=1 Tax=Trichonephila clavipes TaxID=2585209 RepID=A0A8X6SM32_TRICX|nr:hypothetical protein TNCV_985871 [Trichonephila clavipes]